MKPFVPRSRRRSRQRWHSAAGVSRCLHPGQCQRVDCWSTLSHLIRPMKTCSDSPRTLRTTVRLPMASRASGTAAENATPMEWTCTRSFSRGRNMVGKTMDYGGVLACFDRADRWRSGCSNESCSRCTPADVNSVLLLQNVTQ